MRNFAQDIPRQVNEIKKETARAILAEIVPATPVLTGAARSNYVTAVGAPSPVIRDNIDKAGEVSIREGDAAISGAQPGQPIYINNNLPYIGALNNGSSKQAAAGFVERAVTRGHEVIREATLKYTV
jgi:hypothetical protein